MATPQRFAILLLVAATLGSTATAFAQCPPGAVCRGASIHGPHGGGAHIYIQYGRPNPPVVYAPPPPQVVYAPPPPQVVYAPPPRVVYAPPPQQQVVIVRPQQQQQVIYTQPAPQTVYVRPSPSQTVIVRSGPNYVQRQNRGRFGLHFGLNGAGGGGSGLGGLSAAFRIRSAERFALDLGIAAYAGHSRQHTATGTYDRNRVEVPVTLDGLLFINPQNMAQAYVVGGLGMSFASLQNAKDPYTYDRAYTYFGGTLGGGVEFRLRPGFALNLEMRAFMRHRIDANAASQPEYVSLGGTDTTNRSIGYQAQFGLTIYM